MEAGDSAAWAGVAEACSVGGRPGGHGACTACSKPSAPTPHTRTIDAGTSSDGSTQLLAQGLEEDLVLIRRDSGSCLDVTAL